jgi:hypothetical protein
MCAIFTDWRKKIKAAAMIPVSLDAWIVANRNQEIKTVPMARGVSHGINL